MYRRRGRPSLRKRAQLTQDRVGPSEMPEQAEPSARQEQSVRPEASASPDWSAQMAALTEVTRRQELLERLCERVAPPQSTVPSAPEQTVLPPTTPTAALAAAVPPPAAVPVAPVAPL
ncbi:uncharacterized protein LOC109704722 [Ananas comosus]|uniref:Uncharacterized protein LOC109704722 n=1 Tax=Ananas comosus TaxID=4615 RepID=A0A6P5ECZ9_ANACO|nr:uncharacterized protein LOC109704722 [Ananas comosus]